MEVLPYEETNSSYYAHDPGAAEVFARIEEAINAGLPGAEVEHTGSTAVPGLAGKNVVDLLLVTERERFGEVLCGLEALGFRESPFGDIPEERPLRVGTVPHRGRRYPVHIHVTRRDSEDHENILFFRDYLRAHPGAAEEYASIKKRAVEAGHVDAAAYNREKQTFILSVLSKRPGA